MRVYRAILAIAAAPCVLAHMPAFTGSTTRENPHDLGDITKNSWALTNTLSPGEVQHYKFTIDGPTTSTSNEKERFYMGLYVPWNGEPDFRFYVAVFGLHANTVCDRWGDGWGRRQLDTSMHGRKLAHPVLPVHRYTSDGTTWLAPSDVELPVSVVGDSGSLPVDYNNTAERLIFIADPAGDLPNKFEAFSPTIFKPRGSCIVDFPRGGEYRIAVWSDDTQIGPRKMAVGLGLAERDVFSPRSLIFFDFTLMRVQGWNGWSAGVLLLPIILVVLLTLGGLVIIKLRKPTYFGTAAGWPTPSRFLATLGASILLGHVVANVMVFSWAVTNANPHGEYMFALITGIILPLCTGSTCLLIGMRVPVCCCCCPGAPSARIHCGHRTALAIFGILHVMLHAGYLVGPISFLLAAFLPPSCANAGLKAAAIEAADKVPPAKTEAKTDTPANDSAPAVGETPATGDAVSGGPKFSTL